MKDATSAFPDLLMDFFSRNSPEDLPGRESALDLVARLYDELANGRSSLQVDPEDEGLGALRNAGLAGEENETKALVVAEKGDLYFRRYFEYEKLLAGKLFDLSGVSRAEDQRLHDQLEQWLGQAPDQLEAAKLALRSNFAVITGGPGTGKTYLLVAILGALLEQDSSLSVDLAAPTGKAAQRMTESIQANLEHFGFSSIVKENFPQHASTLHRLLRPLPPSIHFRRNSKSPLNADIVIVDEASMIDLPLMTKLVDAVKPTSRLLFIGDVDQLAPVEAGAPLASIVRFFEKRDRSGLVAKLSINRRFGGESSIHALCQAIARGDEQSALNLIGQGGKEDLDHEENGLSRQADEVIRKGYAPLALAKTPEEAHAAFLRFQILCPTHEGETGVNPTNQRIQRLLGVDQRERDQSGRYAGMPIIIEKNDYGVELFNGDIGIFLPDPDNSGELSAWFMRSDGAFRSVSPARLPPHSPAYAMTVHKSQGSEYDEVMVLLPPRHSEILTRHLLYVACSRAKEKVHLFGSIETIEETIRAVTPSSNGMEHRLEQATGMTD